MGKLVFMFPGQGSQYVGMGKDFYDTYSEAKEVFALAGEASGLDMEKLCFEENEDINITEYTQIAMLADEVAILKVLEAKGIKADITAGLSLGEYGALAAADVMDLKDLFHIIRKRGIFMQEAYPVGGAMTAVLGLDGEKINEICAATEGIVTVANYNCPGQLVISGANAAVDEACERLKAAGARRALRLPVGGAFHSPLMEPARQELEAAIAEASFAAPACPVYQNVDAKPYTDPAAIKANLIAQLTAPVRWTQIVENMIADGIDEFTELGPGTVLQGLITKVSREAKAESKSTL